MGKLTVRSISKSFGAVDVLRDVSLDAARGEFLTLLGPSGCGKSTLLRIIAGLEQQDRGTISIGEQTVDHLRPQDRDVAMVFQSYALYPHMTVEENLALPLKMRRLSTTQRLPFIGRFVPGARATNAAIDREVRAVAASLALGSLIGRKPGQLSGGQRQRVALARAMVRRPAMFLMDEPLSNLDAKLRAQMRAEIADLRNKVDATFVYVTHDQTEAMTMSDRVAVMFEGRIAQIGPPHVLYEEPATRTVAEFIGSPCINMLDATVHAGSKVQVAGCELEIGCELPVGAPVTLGIRPEAMQLSDGAGPAVLSGQVQRVEYLGSDVLIHFRVTARDLPLVLRASPQEAGPLRPGTPVRIAVTADLVLPFDPDGNAIKRHSTKTATITTTKDHRLSQAP